MATVQIDKKLFISLVNFFSDKELQRLYPEAANIEEQLQNKLKRMANRNSFTEYKTAPTASEREFARQAYLDQRGIPEDFRSPTEVDFEKELERLKKDNTL